MYLHNIILTYKIKMTEVKNIKYIIVLGYNIIIVL